jgi:hypothetical protein
MTVDDSAVGYCKRDLETYRKLLADYKAGRRKIGDSSDGRSWTDTTSEQIAFLEEKIKELAAFLETRSG